MSALNNMVFNKPDVVIVDLRPIFIRYSPSAPIQSYLYRENPLLRRFIEVFTVHRLIEAGFVLHYDTLGQEAVLWEFVESLFPEGFKDFDKSFDSDISNYDWLQILYEAVVEEVDDLLRRKTEEYGIGSIYQDYLFDKWIGPSTAAFTHREYSPR